MDLEDHSHMITAMNEPGTLDSMPMESSILFNNDFIGKNMSILPFYREHDREKREAFNRIRDGLTILAKQKRTAVLEERRMRYLDDRKKWDRYREAREQVAIIKEGILRKKHACHMWVVFSSLHARLCAIRKALDDHAEAEAAKAKEEAIRKKQEAALKAQQDLSPSIPPDSPALKKVVSAEKPAEGEQPTEAPALEIKQQELDADDGEEEEAP